MTFSFSFVSEGLYIFRLLGILLRHQPSLRMLFVGGVLRSFVLFGRDGLLLADPGVVLNLLDGPAVSDPGYHVV